MTGFQWAEALGYVVTILGLPLAILVFRFAQRRQRQNEAEEIYQRLSDGPSNHETNPPVVINPANRFLPGTLSPSAAG